MKNYVLTQQLLPDPALPNINKKMVVDNANYQAQYGQIVLEAHIEYFNEQGENITSKFRSKIDNWIINDTKTTTERDGQGNPLPNPDYINEESTPNVEKFLKKPSFSYFQSLIEQGVDLLTLLSSHIRFDDANGDFNF